MNALSRLTLIVLLLLLNTSAHASPVIDAYIVANDGVKPNTLVTYYVEFDPSVYIVEISAVNMRIEHVRTPDDCINTSKGIECVVNNPLYVIHAYVTNYGACLPYIDLVLYTNYDSTPLTLRTPAERAYSDGVCFAQYLPMVTNGAD